MSRLLQFIEGRLQRRLILYLLPLVVLPILIIGGLLLSNYQDFARRALIEQELIHIQNDQAEMLQFLARARNDILYMVRSENVNELADALLEQNATRIQRMKSEVETDFVALATSQGIYSQIRYLNVAGDEIVRVDYSPETGTKIIPGTELQNKADRSYFRDAIRLLPGELYISPLDLNREGSPPTIQVLDNGAVVPTLRYATPVYFADPNGEEQLAGVIVINVIAQQLLDIIRVQRANSYVFLLNSNGYYLYNSENPKLEFAFEPDIQTVFPDNIVGEAGLVDNVLLDDAFKVRAASTTPANLTTTADNGRYLIDYVKIIPPGAPENYYFILGDANEQSVFFAPLQSSIFVGIIGMALTIVIALIAVTFIAGQISHPLRLLGRQAEQVASGDLNITNIPELENRQDEIGTLSQTFTDMTLRLKELLGSLEARIAARTADLATSADIANAANQVRELNDLLSLVVNLIRDRFNFYYVQVYLVDRDRKFAVLREGTGYVGRRLRVREHKLILDEPSLVADAIKTGKSIITQDTLADPSFRPNDLLPETRAELVIPLKTQQTVSGVLDIQHNVPNAFDPESIKLFETLAEQLAVTFENVQLLENTARRARELQTVSEVSATAASTLNITEMLRKVTRLTRDNFGLYHAHVYLLDEAKQYLVLAAGAGEVGLQMVELGHKIALNHPHSLVARAARTAEGVIANDVHKTEDFLPNPLLPDTQSELAVPMVVNEEVIGVLDVQSNTTNRFDEDDIRIKTTLAGQIAIAVQNARAFAAIQEAQNVLKQQGTILDNARDYIALTTMDGTLVYANPGAARMTLYASANELIGKHIPDFHDASGLRLVMDTGVPEALEKGVWAGENRLKTAKGTFIPVDQTLFIVRDADGYPRNIATIMVDITERKATEQEQNTLFTITTALNEARTPKMVLEALMTHGAILGMDTASLFYINNNIAGEPDILEVVASLSLSEEIMAIPIGTQFTLHEFEALAAWLHNPQDIVIHEDIATDETLDDMTRAIYMQFGALAVVRIPLHLYGRWIGMLLFKWLAPRTFTQRDRRILNSIANQVKASVESIRTADDIHKRANELATVATVSSEASATLDTQLLIENVVNLTKERFELYHAHIYLLDEAKQHLVLAGGAGEPGRIMKERKFKLSMSNPNSLVVQAVRTRQGVISNDVTLEHNYLPNPLLPDTRSELAVPMFAGSDVIGVLDVQSVKLNRFTPDDVRIMFTLATQIAIGVQNARLFERSNARARDMRLVAEIGTQISSLLDEQLLVETIAETTAKGFDLYHIHIWLATENNQLLMAAGHGRQPCKHAGQNYRLDIATSKHPAALAARNHRTIVNNQVTSAPDYEADPNLPATQAQLVIPMLVGERLIGVFEAHNDFENAFDEDDRIVKGVLAGQMAVALDNARSYVQSSRRAVELQAVAQISAAITATRNLDDLLWTVATQTQQNFHRYHVQVYLLDESGEILVLKAGSGEAGEQMVAQGHRISIKQQNSIVATAARTRSPQVVQDVADVDFFLPNPLLFDTQSELAVPLIYGDTLLGVLDIQDNKTDQFTDIEVQVKSTLANQIAVAIQNTRAFEEVEKARRETERIFNTSIDLIGSATFEGYFVSLNPAWEVTLGYTREELMAQPFITFVHPDDLEKTLSESARLSEGATTVSFENRYQTRDGDYRWISWRAAPDTEAELIHFVASDITEQKLAAEAIAAAQQETERIFTSSIDLLGSATFDGYFIRLNPAWSQVLGFSNDELMSEPFINFVHPDDVESTLAEAAKLSQGINVIAFENRYRCKDGSYRWISWRSVSDMENGLIHFVARDVTERVQEQEEQNILYEVSRRLTDAQTPEEVYHAVLAYGETAGATSGGLFYVVDHDEHGTPTWVEATVVWNTLGSSIVTQGTRYYLPDFPFSKIWLSAQEVPVFYENISTNPIIDEHTRHIYQSIGVQSGITLGLQTQGRWLGIIVIDWSTPHTFSERDNRILTAIMRQATTAVDAIRAAEANRIARRRAEILADINSALSQAHDEEGILAAVGLYIENFHPTHMSLLYIHTDENDVPISLSSVTSRRNGLTDREDPLLGIEFLLEEYPLGQFVLNYPDELVIIEDYTQDERIDNILRLLLEQFKYASLAMMPLRNAGKWQGVLLIAWSQTHLFSDEEKYILSQVMDTTAAVVATRRAARLTEKRAAELEAVARVGAATTTMLRVDDLLYTVVELTKSSFDLYHAHIYLVDDENKRLVLAAGAGEAGEKMKAAGHSISLNHAYSIVARAARTRAGVIANDVTTAEAYLPNPLLPDTRSEMAIPMIVGDELIGVLDVQSARVNRFNADDLRVQTTLADQVAVAILNARAFERERRTIERLREIDRLKQEFLANMSHELRTPLNSIIGYSEVLLDGVDGDLTDEAIEDVEAIHNSGKHLLSLINEILDMAKIEAGQMQLSFKELNLVEILQDVVRSNQILLKDKPVQMQLVEETPLSGLISADKVRLNQVLLNLLSNAIKFTEQGSIIISYGMYNETHAVVRVKDSGIGMNEDHLNVIFERFRQVDGSSTRRAGGTGLGLAITRQLVQMHGGDIFVESQEGVGSTFWFTLPLAKPAPTAETSSNGRAAVPSGD